MDIRDIAVGDAPFIVDLSGNGSFRFIRADGYDLNVDITRFRCVYIRTENNAPGCTEDAGIPSRGNPTQPPAGTGSSSNQNTSPASSGDTPASPDNSRCPNDKTDKAKIKKPGYDPCAKKTAPP
ncbi:MAG TPA: hypothetical protein VKY74_13010 [Chloroflexia bacterium]|nr:hypothetical protein [Chloroflexia bacterium]